MTKIEEKCVFCAISVNVEDMTISTLPLPPITVYPVIPLSLFAY